MDKDMDETQEAAEILTDLLTGQNLVSVPSTDDSKDGTTGTQVQEAQAAALQQLVSGNNVLNERSVRALLDAMGSGGEEDQKHVFWDTQPMLNHQVANSTKSPTYSDHNWHKPIIPSKPSSELRSDPYNMPKGFEWIEVDINSPNECTEIYDLLYQNYVEDDGCTFRFDYSKEFLRWALTPPGYKKQFHLGVRSTKSGRLMALITAIPAKIGVYGVTMEVAEVNFLCVHKKLRSKRLAPVLIKEITRRVNHTGVFQAVYTAGVVLPGHVASCRYYHRTLDVRKLVEIGFTRVNERMTMARMQKLNKLPNETCTLGLRPMTNEDVPGAFRLMSDYMTKFKLAVIFSEEEFKHWLLPRKGVVSSFVVVREGSNQVTDFCSYYHLHSSVLGNPKHTSLFAGYSFYNVATSVDLTELMRDCLILAKKEGLDVFNALNLMENAKFLDELKFGMGDGNLQYYIYNWFCPTMENDDVGIVLL